MRHWPRLRKIATRIFAAVCLLFLLTLAVVQIGQRVLRRRAERLIADLQQLHGGGNTWKDMQLLMTRWGKYGHYNGTCTAQKCEYQIFVGDEIEDVPNGYLMAVLPLLRLAHWHDGFLRVYLRVDSGRVTEWRAVLGTDVPPGYGPSWQEWKYGGSEPEGYIPYSSGEYQLLAEAHSTSTPRKYQLQWPGRTPTTHPEYSITEPDGCTICMAIIVDFTPAIPHDELKRLMNFNASCITRWAPCVDERDINPTAQRELQAELNDSHRLYDQIAHCSFSIQQLTLASNLILRVRVVGDPVGSPEQDIARFYPTRLVEILHGESPWKLNSALRVYALQQNGKPKFPIANGTELLLLQPFINQAEVETVEPHECGVIASSPENLTLIRKAALSIPPATPDRP